MKDASPAVTVYIANHNYGRYIEQAIESVLNQTMQDFELIVIDDGSTDDSRKIVERYMDRPNVLAIFQHNKGLTVTNNIALRAATGRHIMRLDADDYLDENALQVLYGVLERNPNIGMVFPDYYVVDEDGEVRDVVQIVPRRSDEQPDGCDAALQRGAGLGFTLPGEVVVQSHVAVGIDQSRQDVEAGGVDPLSGRGKGAFVADGGDLPVPDRQTGPDHALLGKDEGSAVDSKVGFHSFFQDSFERRDQKTSAIMMMGIRRMPSAAHRA